MRESCSMTAEVPDMHSANLTLYWIVIEASQLSTEPDDPCSELRA